ncbi:GNAT family N-acetyltransferase [Providencia vermicola]
MPELEPLIAQWFLQEWPSHYGPLGKGDVWHDIAAYRHREGTGMGIIAFVENIPCGFIALKSETFLPNNTLFPWVGAAFVIPEKRNQGLGQYLFEQLELIIDKQQYPQIFCATAVADNLLIRCGWQLSVALSQLSLRIYHKYI